ncbi:hypothetical protein PYDG_00015 [Pseudoalteromonas phage pYD6-A]|uniref:Uncharacterized protein n=1 Tax=Pseudoalteromonas phage pYD6-A TaxID=754052 RepID=M4SMF5_9CAUD|nr:hypothetical protein PYDG_00015 [Pseudoalteromonas phage pYD6-A]AGH57547.1 hypothetical protein PYDG_00015 [Pseudoalteromonas phage pYD6-A]
MPKFTLRTDSDGDYWIFMDDQSLSARNLITDSVAVADSILISTTAIENRGLIDFITANERFNLSKPILSAPTFKELVALIELNKLLGEFD